MGVLPLFIINNLGASRSVLGMIDGSAELINYIFRMISGSLSDKLKKRKIFILIGYGLSTVSKPFFAVSSGWLDAFIVKVTDPIGKGVRTSPRDALIADSVSETISGKAFGIHRTIDSAGVSWDQSLHTLFTINEYSLGISFFINTGCHCSYNFDIFCKRNNYYRKKINHKNNFFL